MTYDEDVRQGLEDRIGYNGLDAVDSVLKPLTLKNEDGRFIRVEPGYVVYDGPRWDRVVYFHLDHYDNRYGPVIDRGQLPPKSRTGWTYA